MNSKNLRIALGIVCGVTFIFGLFLPLLSSIIGSLNMFGVIFGSPIADAAFEDSAGIRIVFIIIYLVCLLLWAVTAVLCFLPNVPNRTVKKLATVTGIITLVVTILSLIFWILGGEVAMYWGIGVGSILLPLCCIAIIVLASQFRKHYLKEEEIA